MFISVAGRLLELGEVNFANLCLRVIRPTQQFDEDDDIYDSCEDSRDDNDDRDDYDDATTAVSPSVVVSNIPKSLSEDYLVMFLENKRFGGGEITKMQFDQKSATAIVTFASPQGNENFSACLCFRSKI